jgi:hypothetical protein
MLCLLPLCWLRVVLVPAAAPAAPRRSWASAQGVLLVGCPWRAGARCLPGTSVRGGSSTVSTDPPVLEHPPQERVGDGVHARDLPSAQARHHVPESLLQSVRSLDCSAQKRARSTSSSSASPARGRRCPSRSPSTASAYCNTRQRRGGNGAGRCHGRELVHVYSSTYTCTCILVVSILQ